MMIISRVGKEDKKMSKEEILREIERIEECEFFLQMKDRWSPHDFDLSREHDQKIRELKKALEEV